MHHCANKICQKVQVEVGMPNKLPQFYPRFKSYRTRIKQSLYDNSSTTYVDIKIFKVSTNTEIINLHVGDQVQ